MKRTRVHDSRARESSRIELTGGERKDDDARRVVRARAERQSLLDTWRVSCDAVGVDAKSTEAGLVSEAVQREAVHVPERR